MEGIDDLVLNMINWNQIVQNKKFMFAKRVNVNKGKLSSWKNASE